MRAFEYASPKQKQQVVALLGKHWGDAEVLAGGRDLLALMKDDIVRPKRLINNNDLKELHGTTFDAKGGLRIGALVTFTELCDGALASKRRPMSAAPS